MTKIRKPCAVSTSPPTREIVLPSVTKGVLCQETHLRQSVEVDAGGFGRPTLCPHPHRHKWAASERCRGGEMERQPSSTGNGKMIVVASDRQSEHPGRPTERRAGVKPTGAFRTAFWIGSVAARSKVGNYLRVGRRLAISGTGPSPAPARSAPSPASARSPACGFGRGGGFGCGVVVPGRGAAGKAVVCGFSAGKAESERTWGATRCLCGGPVVAADPVAVAAPVGAGPPHEHRGAASRARERRERGGRGQRPFTEGGVGRPGRRGT